jgi:hypothetical protein
MRPSRPINNPAHVSSTAGYLWSVEQLFGPILLFAIFFAKIVLFSAARNATKTGDFLSGQRSVHNLAIFAKEMEFMGTG